MNKNTPLLTALFLFGAAEISAQEPVWLLQDGLTPQTLSSAGATLVETDSMAWPDGRSVFVTYWLGVGDDVLRCAEIRDGESTSASCWQRELAAGLGMTSKPVARSISTRRRPLPFDPYRARHALYPYVWVGAHHSVPRPIGQD